MGTNVGGRARYGFPHNMAGTSLVMTAIATCQKQIPTVPLFQTSRGCYRLQRCFHYCLEPSIHCPWCAELTQSSCPSLSTRQCQSDSLERILIHCNVQYHPALHHLADSSLGVASKRVPPYCHALWGPSDSYSTERIEDLTECFECKQYPKHAGSAMSCYRQQSIVTDARSENQYPSPEAVIHEDYLPMDYLPTPARSAATVRADRVG